MFVFICRIVPSGEDPNSHHGNAQQTRTEVEVHPRKCGITLTQDEYYTVPPVEVLDDLCKEGEELLVQDFVVGRKNFGKIKFLEQTSVKGLNLDELGETSY